MTDLKNNFNRVLRAIYHHLPLSNKAKQRAKRFYLKVRNKDLTESTATTASVLPTAKVHVRKGKRGSRLHLQDLSSRGREINDGGEHPDSPQRESRTSCFAEIEIFHSFSDYMDDEKKRVAKRQERATKETGLIKNQGEPFTIPGYCAVCLANRQFNVDYRYAYQRDDNNQLIPNWRESVVCCHCNMNNRVRACVDLLSNRFTMFENDQIYTTEVLTPFYQWLSSGFSNVVGSEFLGDDEAGGEIYNNLRHEDITSLSFEDASIDCILSFDVLEHVPDTRSSLSEFLRCLKPGGFIIITAPFVSNQFETITRAKIQPDGKVLHIMEPEYHGNPTKPEEGSLCYYHFGWDLLDQLRTAGATDAAVLSYYSAGMANVGPEQLFFIASK